MSYCDIECEKETIMPFTVFYQNEEKKYSQGQCTSVIKTSRDFFV